MYWEAVHPKNLINKVAVLRMQNQIVGMSPESRNNIRDSNVAVLRITEWNLFLISGDVLRTLFFISEDVLRVN